MTLQDAQGFVADHRAALLETLSDYRLAIYQNSLAALLPYGTRQEIQAANDAQARCGLAVDAAKEQLHDFLTQGEEFEHFEQMTGEAAAALLASMGPLPDARDIDENAEADQ